MGDLAAADLLGPESVSLLPPIRTAWEEAQSETSAVRRPLPAHFVKDVWNPATCPVDLLPYLAAGLGLEIWNPAWPEARQREIVADIWRLKRNKTKLKGLKAYLELTDAALVSAHRPRDKRWWVSTLSDAERAAQMAAMPQIRIAVEVAPAVGPIAKKFWGGRFVKQFWSNGIAWLASDAPARYAARATYVDDGVSTPVTVRGLDDLLDASIVVELSVGASVAKAFWSGKTTKRFWGQPVAWMASDADQHALAITPSTAAPSFAVPTGLVPTQVRPVRVSATAPMRAGQRFWGWSAWGTGAYLASDADAHVYDQVTLFDPTRLVATKQPYSFWGWSRWGRPFPEADIRVDVALTRSPYQQGWSTPGQGKPWGRMFWMKSDMSPFWRALEAVGVSKAFRDFVWVDTTLYQPIRFTAGLRFGDQGFAKFGDTRKLT